MDHPWVRRMAAIVAVGLIVGIGCSSGGQKGTGATSGRGARTSQPNRTPSAGLPPAGSHPLIGTKPPMPSPVRRAEVREVRVEDFATGLQVPWEMVFLPGGRVLVTERPGRVRLIENGRLRQEPYATIASAGRGEGGLLGIAAHPNYPNPREIYLMYTYRSQGRAFNRVSRFTDTGNGLTNERAIINGIAAESYHNGGVLEFGPDGKLYIGTGDAGRPERAQDMNSPNGKILRVNPDGSIPGDNPFPRSRVYALGLRNVEGLAWQPGTNALWATNHGPSGEYGLHAMDSVFVVKPGANLGWPRTLGVVNRRGVTDPILFFPGSAVPPAGAIFYTGRLFPGYHGNFFFASLRGEHLERVVIGPGNKIQRIERWWETGNHRGRYGRLRAVSQGPDGAIYVSTSNRDGRGSPRAGDDRILRIVPAGR